MRNWLIVAGLLFAVPMGGCGDPELRETVRDLQVEVVLLESEVLALKMTDAFRAQNDVSLDPADDGFVTSVTEYGTLAFIVRGVQPFGDGSRVTLMIGNLTSGTINGGRMGVSYGERRVFGASSQEDWRQSLARTEVSFSTDLQPGRWSAVRFTLPGVQPEGLGYLRLSNLEFSGMTLQ